MCSQGRLAILLVLLEVIAFVHATTPRTKVLIKDICKVSISEIHFPNDDKAFVELQEYCSRRKPGPKTLAALRGYKLLLASEEKQQLIMVIDLGNKDLYFRDEEKFYVIGTKSTAPGIATLASPAVQNVYIESSKFPVEKGKAYAWFLVRATETRTMDFRLQRRTGNVFIERNMDSDMQRIIAANLVDFLSFCMASSCGSSTRFQPMLSSLSTEWKNMKSFPATTAESISYCGPNTIEYSPRHYLKSVPTPGGPNKCFAMPPVTVPDSGSSEILPTALPEGSINKNYNVAIMGRKSRAYRLHQVKGYKKSLSKQPEEPSQECLKMLPDGGAILRRSFVQDWIQGVSSEGKCCFTCRICKQFYDSGFRPDVNKVRKRSKISNEGVCGLTANENHKSIIDHTTDPVHIAATALMAELRQRPSEMESVLASYDETEYDLYKPTVDLIRLAYTEIRSDTPFSSHETFTTSLKLMGVNLGHHHYDDMGIVAITRAISKDFRKTLLQYLVDTQNPFSLIADGSHDNANNHLFCVIFQTFEMNRPVKYFYGLLNLKKGEKSKQIVADLLEQVDEDDRIVPGFKAYFVERLYAMTSDGASVMTGIRQSVHTELKALTKRPILLSKCMAHSLELSTKKAILSLGNSGYLQSMENKTNKVHSYYMSRGSLRWLKFSEIGLDLGVKVKRFKLHYNVRWSSSHFEAMSSMWHNFYVALKDLKHSKQDKSVPAKARKSAEKLYGTISNKNFPLYLNELLDYLGVYKGISLELEKSKGTLLGKRDLVHREINHLKLLSTRPGTYLGNFLKSCTCDSNTCTLDTYESCAQPTCNGYKLESVSPTESTALLSEIRESLYKTSVDQLASYFDFDRLDAYNLLDWRKTYSQDDLLKFCSLHHWDPFVCRDFGKQFTELKKIVLQTFPQEKIMASEPIDIWTEVFNSQTLISSESLNATLRGVLTIPMSSADAERVFSLVTRIKSRERSRLSPENLEHIIRIKMNGPEELRDFDAFYYSKVFLKSHVRADETGVGGKRKNPENSAKENRLSSSLF